MSKQEKTLMGKTKAQLVEIITRKDDEEIRLKNRVQNLERENDVANKTISHLKKSLEDANRNIEQHQAGMDELTSQKVVAEEAAKKFEKERNAAYGWNWALATAIVIVTTLWILL